PHLPSLPTRRSSDLGCKRLAQSPVRVEVTALVAARLVPLLLGLLCADAVQLVNDLLALRLHLPVSVEGEASTGPRFVPLLLGLEDRKSTRLNSSHVS